MIKWIKAWWRTRKHRKYNSLQEVFNGVWQHFVVEKQPQSIKIRPDGTPKCLYGSCGCAIGCLIDDKALCEKLDHPGTIGDDGVDVFTVFRRFREPLEQIFLYVPKAKDRHVEIHTLRMLQGIHDNYCDWPPSNFTEYMREALTKFARTYKLEIPK